MSLSDNVASNYRLFCARTHIHPAFNQRTVTQADMERLNLLLHRAFTIEFHTCSNKPVYVFREDWCRNLQASPAAGRQCFRLCPELWNKNKPCSHCQSESECTVASLALTKEVEHSRKAFRASRVQSRKHKNVLYQRWEI